MKQIFYWMKFIKLKLFTNKLEAERVFYSQTLGFELLDTLKDKFTVKVGGTELTFEYSDKMHSYHYCFLIPCNQLQEALIWMEERTELIDIENGRKIQRFESWNADSFYFLDASGNVAEIIVRYDLENESGLPFNISSILGVNEMGMPTSNVAQTNEKLEKELQTKFWKGDMKRFGTNGNQEGIWLLPNYNIKDVWFPTQGKIIAEDFEALVENNRTIFQILFQKEQLEITKVE